MNRQRQEQHLHQECSVCRHRQELPTILVVAMPELLRQMYCIASCETLLRNHLRYQIRILLFHLEQTHLIRISSNTFHSLFAGLQLLYMATKNEPEAVVRTECLCQFVETLQSPWSPAAWSSCADLDLNLEPGTQTYFAFDVTPRRNHAALVAAQVLPNSKIAVGLVQEWKSETAIDDLEMANGVAEWCRMYDVT